MSNRIAIRTSFLTADRVPVIVFFTSSRAKFAQAKMILESSGTRLTYRTHDSQPYDEEYGGTKEFLLKRAIDQIERRGGANGGYFFVEDTTVRVECLSDGGADYPGLATKEWFAETSFAELNAMIIAKGGDRTASVESVIALHIPALHRIEYFYGRTHGKVVASEFDISHGFDPLYPWIGGQSFNSWFIPDGCEKPLGGMSYEESLDFDFRAKSLLRLVDRIEEYSIAMNSPVSMYTRRPRVHRSQPALFDIDIPLTVVIGPTCSGKTTLGHYLQHNMDAKFIDASDVVRVLQERAEAFDQDTSDFAEHIIREEGADVVARCVSSEFIDNHIGSMVVVTGFRTIEEIEFFRQKYPRVRIVSIECPQRVRFERYVRRNSRKRLTRIEEFIDHDERQHLLGLLRVSSDLADVVITNSSGVDEFFLQVDKVFKGLDVASQPQYFSSVRLNPEKSQLYRCLDVLRHSGRPMTTQEIAKSFDSRSIRHNNANKILKRFPEFSRRQEVTGSNVRYTILPAGLAFLGAVDSLNRAPRD